MPIRRSPNGARHVRSQPGRNRPERVVAINRNAWSQSVGTGGRNHPVRALVSLLTIHDLMHEGQKIISVSYRSLEVYLVIALIYFMLTGLTTIALRRLEIRLRAGGMVQ